MVTITPEFRIAGSIPVILDLLARPVPQTRPPCPQAREPERG
ncbi:MAG: hypothetical protein ACYDHX_15760 [Methanothrix sp.]